MTTAISMAQASDAELASAVIGAGLAGSPAAEAELCRRFGRRVRLYGRSRLRDGSGHRALARLRGCMDLGPEEASA